MVTNGQTTSEVTEIIATSIPVALLSPSPLNRKCDDTDADIAELARTIEETGLLSPISARPMGRGSYEIICGERRWRAFRLLERETIPCFIKDLDDTQAQIERIVENYQRRDPSFMEQGEAVAALMELTDRDVSEVANRLGQSVSWVRRRAKLPNLIQAWREELAKDGTPYFAIQNSVNRLEELAVLPAATQKTLLDSNVLRHAKTTKEMRSTIAKHFMDLDVKPWARAWEKKAFSGSGKKRCDACMKRSDRESALFTDPNDTNAGKKMCIDPECWKDKCLSWCKSLIADNPDMVPIRQGYSYGDDSLTDFFGVKPVSYYDWQERDVSEIEQEGHTAAVGVLVDGPNIGVTRTIWLGLPDEDDEDSNVFEVRTWRENNANKYRERQILAELITKDIAAYLTEIDVNATIPAVQLASNQLRAAAWFGLYGYANSEEETANLDDPDWNPLAWAWEQTAEHIAEHVASVTAENIAQLHNGDRDYSTDANNAAALVAMFEIPLSVIATRATEELHKTTHEEQDTDPISQDNDEDTDGVAVEASPEPVAPAVAVKADTLTDPEEFIEIDEIPYLHALADAQ